MSNTKKTNRKLLEVKVRIKELERAQPYLTSDYYYRRKDQLIKEEKSLKNKWDNNELAPDIQFILTESEG